MMAQREEWGCFTCVVSHRISLVGVEVWKRLLGKE